MYVHLVSGETVDGVEGRRRDRLLPRYISVFLGLPVSEEETRSGLSQVYSR